MARRPLAAMERAADAGNPLSWPVRMDLAAESLGSGLMTYSEQHHDHELHADGPVSDEMFGEEFWDQRYGASSALWSGRPNPQLVAEAAALTPRLALDAGCGEGADAIWLAEQGWQVTAVDVSTVALGRAAGHAAQRGSDVAGRISWQQQDLLTWGPQPRSYDLVTAQFIQLPARHRIGLFERLTAGVAAGGTLLIVGHSPSDLETTARRPRSAELFFTANDIAATLDLSRWTILVSEARPREAKDPDGRLITVHDEVLAARHN